MLGMVLEDGVTFDDAINGEHLSTQGLLIRRLINIAQNVVKNQRRPSGRSGFSPHTSSFHTRSMSPRSCASTKSLIRWLDG